MPSDNFRNCPYCHSFCVLNAMFAAANTTGCPNSHHCSYNLSHAVSFLCSILCRSPRHAYVPAVCASTKLLSLPIHKRVQCILPPAFVWPPSSAADTSFRFRNCAKSFACRRSSGTSPGSPTGPIGGTAAPIVYNQATFLLRARACAPKRRCHFSALVTPGRKT